MLFPKFVLTDYAHVSSSGMRTSVAVTIAASPYHFDQNQTRYKLFVNKLPEMEKGAYLPCSGRSETCAGETATTSSAPTVKKLDHASEIES